MKLFDAQGRPKIAIDKKFLIILGIITFLILLFWYVKTMAKPIFYSCTQAKAAGYHDIPRSSSLYRPDLDKDMDGYACE